MLPKRKDVDCTEAANKLSQRPISDEIDQATARDQLLDRNRRCGHLCSKDAVLLRKMNVLNTSVTDAYTDHVFQYLVPLALSNDAQKRSGTKVMPLFFFSETTIAFIMKSIYIAHTSFIKLRLFFHKMSFIIKTLFPPLRETLYASRVKLFAEASKLLMLVCSGRRRRRQNGVVGVQHSEAQKDRRRREGHKLGL